MKKKVMISSVLILSILIIGSIILLFYIFWGFEKETKIYDWNVQLILCKECSPYQQEIVSLQDEEMMRGILISNFEKEEIIFDRFDTNVIYINMTNDAYYKLNNIIDKINSNSSIGITIRTVYFNRIIDQEEQKEPSSEEEIYVCKEDRECLLVNNGCCGCGAGGTAISINKDYSNYWNNKLTEGCKEMGCVAVMSNDWTCFARPRCINNRCGLSDENCAKEGEMFYPETGKSPERCCKGLTEWMAGCDRRRISIADKCYWDGMVGCAPYGICINCGNGICEDVEGVCNCPQDCIGKNKSTYKTTEEFCASEWKGKYEEMCKDIKDLELCSLCS